MEDAPVPQLPVADILAKIDRGDDLLLLDVRNDEEFGAWKLEGANPVVTIHIPYFEFIEDEASSLARVPRDGREVVVLCAKGGSSEMVAGMLREAGVPAENVAGGMVAYGEYLEPVKVRLRFAEEPRFEIWQVNRRGKGCLSYVIRVQDEAIVVDPSRHVEWYEDFLKRLGARLVRVMDTHVHADHLSGGPALARRSGAPYWVVAGEGFELRQLVEPFRDRDEIRLSGPGGVRVEVRVVATPGHTPGSTSFLVGGRYLLSGDTLFVASIGRPDLGGQLVEWGRALFHTLRDRLAPMPDDTVVLPAHYADVKEMGADGVVSGELGVLRRTVPELQLESEDAFIEAIGSAMKKAPERYTDIIRVNLGLAAVAPDQATEWELGKNECAASARPR